MYLQNYATETHFLLDIKPENIFPIIVISIARSKKKQWVNTFKK